MMIILLVIMMMALMMNITKIMITGMTMTMSLLKRILKASCHVFMP